MLGLMRQFKLADDDGSKSLSQVEFAKAIKVYGLDLTEPEMVELFNKFDEDKSGYIEYEEFARQIMRVSEDDLLLLLMLLLFVAAVVSFSSSPFL